MQDVHETLNYEVHDWTRTCAAPLVVTAKTSWRTDMQTTLRFTPDASTTDRSHRGHDLSDLEEDPKAFPDSDTELLGFFRARRDDDPDPVRLVLVGLIEPARVEIARRRHEDVRERTGVVEELSTDVQREVHPLLGDQCIDVMPAQDVCHLVREHAGELVLVAQREEQAPAHEDVARRRREGVDTRGR